MDYPGFQSPLVADDLIGTLKNHNHSKVSLDSDSAEAQCSSLVFVTFCLSCQRRYEGISLNRLYYSCNTLH